MSDSIWITNEYTKAQIMSMNHKGKWELKHQIKYLKLMDEDNIIGLKKMYNEIKDEREKLWIKDFELKIKQDLIQRGYEALARPNNYDHLKKHYQPEEKRKKK